MAIANFDELCRGFCDIAGFATPAQHIDRNGQRSISVRLRGIYLTILEYAQDGEDAAILVAEFGAMPERQTQTGWLALMDANLFMLDGQGPRFCRHPRTGDVILQWTCPLWGLSATEVHRRAMQMMEVALLWRDDHLLGSQDRSPTSWRTNQLAAVACCSNEVAESIARFRLFHQDVCRALGQPVTLPLLPADSCAFSIRLPTLGTELKILHEPASKLGVAFVAVPFGLPLERELEHRVEELMTANFKLMKQQCGLTFCRNPWSGELMLAYAWRLANNDVQEFLSQALALAQWGRQWDQTPTPSDASGPLAASLELA